jgi:hypothetical protein
MNILSCMMGMQLLAKIIFGIYPDEVGYWDCCIERIPVLEVGTCILLLLLLMLGLIFSYCRYFRSRLRSALSLVRIAESRANVKFIVGLVLFKRLVLLKSLHLLHVQLELGHRVLSLQHMLL